jgi:hypothetical protein
LRTLFDPATRQGIADRLKKLTPDAPRQWGKMSASQMMAHCSRAMEVGTGDLPLGQSLVGRIFSPFARKTFLSEKPFSRNSPTDPHFVVRDEKDFAKEKAHLTGLIARFCEAGPAAAGKHPHSFLGKISGEDWGLVMYKHHDHHQRQFGA